MRFKNLLLALLVAFVAMPLAAQLENGKIYRFVNKANTNIALEAASTTDIYGSAIGDRYSQYWLAETHPSNSAAWSLRSLGNGLYVVPRGTSTGWTFSASKNSSTVLYCVNTNGNYYTFNSKNHADDSNCMHYATSQGGRVVGWNTGADATHWTIEEVTVNETELQKNWEELNAFNNALTEESIAKFEAALANLFSDKACTQLKKSFASVADIEADADYQALHADLQAMVKKVYTDNWQEDNFDSSKPYWDSEHAKRFRIQNIEPYSVAGEITEWLGINAHINMDNPLGITGNYRQHVFVIVEGEIKDGAELTLGSLQGHGLLATYDNGIPLKEGLNVVPFHGNGNTLYVNYVVHTYQNGKFVNPLSGYNYIKVHVAGGNVNGYYNGVGDHLWGEPDDDDDWQYYEDRTNTESATILGKRQILHFTMWPTQVTDDETGSTWLEENCMSKFFPDNISVPAGTPAKQKVNKVLEAWDRIHLSELATMGLLSKAEMDSLNKLYHRWDKTWKNNAGNIYDYTEAMYEERNGVDYSEHFNHHGIALGNFSGYMSGGWRNCNYNQNTMGEIIGGIAVGAGQTWGPAHEIGHQHQKVFTVNGLTEVTNNFHSNVAVWYMGMGTSRVNGSSGNLDNVYNNYKNNRHFLFHAVGDGSQNLWSQTQMYYRLWLYYHRAGHKTDFFPILFELNRRDRMSSNNLGWIDGKGHASGTESMLKYYKQACKAAGEDLTEFFRAYGFFALMEQQERGDYSTSFYTQTQAEVDAAIAWVKAQGYKENLAPLFINDCVATPSYGHDGKTVRSYWDGETASGENAKIGMYVDLLDESVKAEGYLYTLYKTTLTIMHDNAKGAIGFIVYDENDNLVAFTNNYTVNLPATATKVKIYAVQADGTKVEVISAAEGGTEEQQLEALKKAITAANSLIKNTSEKKYASYIRSSVVAELQEMVAEAQAAIDNQDQSLYTYGAWAMNLTNATNEIKTNQNSFVGIKGLNHYELRCAEGNFGYYLAYYDNGMKAATQSQVAKTNDDRRWEFVEVEGEEGVYYLKNVGQKLYIAEINSGSNVLLTSPVPMAKFTILYNGDGTASILKAGEPNVSLYRSNSTDNSIVGKEPGEKRSQWRIELYADNATEAEIAELEALVAEAERVIAEAGNGIDNLAVYVSDIELANFVRILTEAKENAEVALADQASVSDFIPYIKALETALANTEAVYVLKPQSSHEETIYYYYLKDVDNGTYAFVNPDATGKYVDALGTGELDTENDNFVWAFVKNSKGEFQMYNKGYDAYLYTLSSSPNPLKADKAADASNYVFSVDNDKKALLITEGNKYLYNSSGRGRIYTSKSYWKIELIGTEEGTLTSIVDVETEATKPVIEGIFDLTGRKLDEITKPGIYIIDGKKTLVK